MSDSLKMHISSIAGGGKIKMVKRLLNVEFSKNRRMSKSQIIVECQNPKNLFLHQLLSFLLMQLRSLEFAMEFATVILVNSLHAACRGALDG